MPARSPRLPQVLLPLLLIVLVAVLRAAPAAAHAELRASDPEADAVLAELPAAVTLDFSEPVGLLAASWLLPGGGEAPASARAAGPRLVVAPPRPASGDAAGEGTYVLRWRVASVDGHPVGGALVFSVGRVTGAAPGAVDPVASVVAVAARAGLALALVLCVGAVLFDRLVQPLPPSAHRLVRDAGFAVMPFAVLFVLADGADRLGLPAGALVSGAPLAEGLRGTALPAVLLALAAVLAALVGMARGALPTVLVAWALAALSFAATGHALTAPAGLGVLLTALHAGAVLFWVGGLPPLAAALASETARDKAARAALLARFGALALPLVLVLIVTGTGLVLLREPDAETLATAWARLLAVKLVLVALMLALALRHRLAGPRTRTQSVAGEAALGLCVLVLAMGFRLAPPPATSAELRSREAATAALSVHIHGSQAMVDLQADAAPPGQVGFRLTLADADFAPLDPIEVALELRDPAAGIGPLAIAARREAPGLWVAAPLTLPTAGPWQVSVSLLVTDFQKTVLEATWPAPAAARSGAGAQGRSD